MLRRQVRRYRHSSHALPCSDMSKVMYPRLTMGIQKSTHGYRGTWCILRLRTLMELTANDTNVSHGMRRQT
eukprot:6182504-Pleurochrysis_carterae.AAC.1